MSFEIIEVRKDTIYMRLPKEVQRPIDGGCECSHCKAHPADTPSWDTLAVARNPKRLDHGWTVHMPERGIVQSNVA